MAKLLLFLELLISDIFHFYDNPDRKLIKSDNTHYIAPEGRRSISPTVGVIKDEPLKNEETYPDEKG